MGREKMKAKRIMLYLILLTITTFISACGGGDGGSGSTATSTTATQSISGVAAAGAPIIGTVTLKDSSSPAVEKTVTISSDGGYTVDVTGLKAPFALRADGSVGGTTYQLYSAATETDINGTINITPFTDLIIANMAGQVAANFYNAGDISGITKTALDAKITELQAKLQPVMTALGMSSSIDLLRTSFATNHTGLDAVMDVIKVTVDPATAVATISNIVTNETITANIAISSYSGSLTAGTMTSSTVSDVQAIGNLWTTFAGFFATSLPSPTNAQMLALFDAATFLDDGQDLNTMLSDLTTDGSLIGMNVSTAITSIDLSAGTAEVQLTLIANGRWPDSTKRKSRVIKKNGTWLSQGNGRIAWTALNVRAEYYPHDASSISPYGYIFQTGLSIGIRADQPAGANVASALVTGPGLPAPGLTFVRNSASSRFLLSGTGGNGYFRMDDTTIASIPDNAEYTYKLLNSSGALLATYTEILPKRPLMRGELSTSLFLTITTPDIATVRAFNGGNLPCAWTLPTGLKSDHITFRLYDAAGTASASTETTMSGTDLSRTLTLQPTTSTGVNFTPASRYLDIGANDVYNRKFATTFR
jgi:hypothetical protein